MFEQTDSAYQTGSGFGSVSGRRGSKQSRKEVSRNSSFRGTKKLKSEDSHSPVLGRAKLGTSTSTTSLLTWKKLRNFGHFDLQSFTIDSLSINKEDSGVNVKKPTGASAAHGSGDTGTTEKCGLSNNLVSCCPAFTNEVGGDEDWLSMGNPILQLRESLSVDKQRRVGSRERMILDGEVPLKTTMQNRGPMSRQVSGLLFPKAGLNYPFEFIDFGASYYRNYFLENEHQNFFGVDENLGPIAISIRRERLPEQLGDFYGLQPTPSLTPPKHLYRVIFRTSELCSLRGTLLEEAIPTGAKTGTSKGIPPRDIVEYVTQGEMQMSCLKLGKNNPKTLQELVRLDEQELNNKYKVGIIYCKPGQETEEEMYNNESGSPAFDEFLQLMGDKVRMMGFNKYRAQLDNKTDTTGEYSVYTEFNESAEVMFHVSTLLPHTASNKQQLLRKRHIGNDIVTIIFQEPGCQQFSPRNIRSHFQHIFIIVRVENPNTKFTKYRVAVSRSTDIPFFGPPIPQGAMFDKNDNFRDFILTKVINACNASLRNQKFSTMAVRTRKQYLIDLAEHSTTSTTIDQANTSGRVAGLLRNLGHKKKERMRQDSTLIYTGGALTWHVSIILRERKPLPFSEEHDNHIECIMGVGPDIIVFIDFHTKDTLLHIPTKDLSGWIMDRTRINVFYENCYCLSIDCMDSEDDLRELVVRMQAVAPKLTASHEAILMEFRRSSTGFLGFTINEVGVVERVDGLAKSSGLQSNSRLLQVEDRLLCCHSHKQITALLTAKDKPLVRTYVIPPPPKGRHLLFYPEVNWLAVWASRPAHGDADESAKVQNGVVERSETQEKLKKAVNVELRKKRSHLRSHSHTNRLSYLQAMQSEREGSNSRPDNLIIDDNEPIYDRLHDRGGVSKPPRSPRSPRDPEGLNFRTVKGFNRATRESVLNLADDMMERNFTKSLDLEYDPQPMEHTVSEVDITSPIQLTTSMQLPDRKPHTSAPLLPRHKRSNSKDMKKELTRRPTIEVTGPLTPKGTVSRMTKMFSFSSQSRIPPPPRHGNSPLKALASTSEMTKSNIPVKAAVATESRVPLKDDNSCSNNVQLRSHGNKRSGGKVRPASFDVSLLINNKKNVTEMSKDDSMIQREEDDLEKTTIFNRNAQIRTAFRKKYLSRELSPEPAEGDIEALESKPFSEPVPRSPTTGALISGDETEVYMEDEGIPEFNELTALIAEEKRLSQNTGSQSSQDSLRNLQMTVRERTQCWEARGGGLPSYFSTLPKSFRHKATDRRADPAYTYAPHGEGLGYYYDYDEGMSEDMLGVSTASRASVASRGSQSGIPLPTSKLRSSRSVTATPPGASSSAATRVRGNQSTGHDKSASPVREAGDKTGSSLPTRTNIQVSSKRTGQLVSQKSEDRVRSPTSVDSGQSLNRIHRSTASLANSQRSSSSQNPQRSGIPLKTGSSQPPSDKAPDPHTDTTSALRSSGVTPSHEGSSALVRQLSSDSLEENFQELDRNLNDLLNRDDRSAKKRDSSHIEEWLRQTSKDAVPPDMLGEPQQSLLREVGSPTFTDKSLNFSQTSDYTSEKIESLRTRVGYLETRLSKESEDNSDLRVKLETAEQRLHEAETKRSMKAAL